MPYDSTAGYIIDEIRFNNNETNEEIPFVSNFVMSQVNSATRVIYMTSKNKVAIAMFILWTFVIVWSFITSYQNQRSNFNTCT